MKGKGKVQIKIIVLKIKILNTQKRENTIKNMWKYAYMNKNM